MSQSSQEDELSSFVSPPVGSTHFRIASVNIF